MIYYLKKLNVEEIHEVFVHLEPILNDEVDTLYLNCLVNAIMSFSPIALHS